MTSYRNPRNDVRAAFGPVEPHDAWRVRDLAQRIGASRIRAILDANAYLDDRPKVSRLARAEMIPRKE